MIGISDANATQITPLREEFSVAGKKMFFETGKLALLSSGSITLSDEEGNVLLVTAGIKEE